MAIFVVILFLLSSAASIAANNNSGINTINQPTNTAGTHTILSVNPQVSAGAINQSPVLKTIVMNNNSLVKGNFLNVSSAIGLSDFYDPLNGLLYYADACSGQLLIINTLSRVVEKTIKVGDFPSMISYDSANGYLYLPNENSHNVTVVNTTSNDVVKSINVGNLPFMSLYVPSSGNIYVSNLNSSNISVISGKSNKVVSSIFTGKNSSPVGMTYDSQNGNLYVAGCTYGNVYVVNTTSNKIVGNISVGKDPFYLSYDNSNSLLYITNPDTNNVTLVNTNTKKIVENLTSFDEPTYETLEGSTDYMYISNDGSGNVSVLDLSTNVILKNINLESTATRGTYNSENNIMYIPTTSNISIINGNTNDLLGFINVTYSPTASTLDTSNGDIYVANCFENDVSVINSATNMLVKNINVGSHPRAITYDSMNGYVYVVNQGSNDVTVINGVTNTVVTTIKVQHYPRAIAYDSSNGNLYVADTGSSNVTVINGMTNTVTATIATQTNPCGLAYDSINGNIYVSIEQHYMVSVIKPSESKVFANITVGSGPIFMTFDSSNGYIYVSNYFSKNVSVIDGSSNKVIKSINVGAHLAGLSYDFVNGYVYGASDDYQNVVQINGATNNMAGNITVGAYPYTTLFDPLNGNLYVGNKNSGSISIIAPAVHKGQYNVTFTRTGIPFGTPWYVNLTDGLSSGQISGTSYTFNLVNSSYNYSSSSDATNGLYYAPCCGSFKVDGSAITEKVQFDALYTINFTRTDLPLDTDWYINITCGNGEVANFGPINGTFFTFYATNGTYNYTVSSNNNVYFFDMGNFTVNGSSVNEQIQFYIMYTMAFNESGLPSGTTWYVNLTDGITSGPITGTTFSFILFNSTYFYNIASSNKLYHSNGGSLIINGSSVTQNIKFSEENYSMTFYENGLKAGYTWYVNLSNGMKSGPIPGSNIQGNFTFYLPNGSYSFTITSANKIYAPDLRSGTFNISGSSIGLGMVFFRVEYSINVTETGLPTGTDWYLNISNLPNNFTFNPTTGNYISCACAVTNGTYSYSIGTPDKTYHAAGGTFTVNGKNIYINITFYKVEYNVLFTEKGLPSGFVWGVNIGTGVSLTSSGNLSVGSEYNLMLTNGTYSYIPYMIDHYFVKSGTIVVHGADISVVINYEKEAFLKIDVNPQTASLSLNGANESLILGQYTSYVKEGYYYISVDEKGYTPYTNFVYLSWNHSYSYSVTLTEIPVYGYLTGIVLPANATVTANGAVIPLMNGYFNTTISPGTYYISVSASGYQGYVTTVKVYENKATSLDVTLQKVSSSVIIQGRLDQLNASLTVNGFVAYVNSTGYFEVSVPAGSVTISAVENGYYPFSETLNLSSSTTLSNIALVKEPAPTSTSTSNGTVSTGYNVTVSGIKPANGYVSLNYTANPNGTLIILLPYNEIQNATITEILESKVYINGVQYKNFTISISSTGSAILTVTHLSGDPTLYWKYSPDASIPKTAAKYSVVFSETGLPSGTTWYVNGSVSGSAASGSTITFSLANGTYTFTVTNTTDYYTTVTQFTVKVSGKDLSESVTYLHYSYIAGNISPSGATVTINGKSVSLSSTGALNMTVAAGSYEVVVSDNGYETVYDNFTLGNGATKNVDLSLKAVAQPAKAVSTLTNDELFAIIGVIALVVVIGAVVVIMRRKN